MTESTNPILLYDGVCGLCNRFVKFILKRDHNDRFRFAALQSEYAAKILARHGVNALDLDTVYLVSSYGQAGERLTNRSNAAIAVFAELGGFWSVVSGFLRVIPRPVRDWGYNLVARSRYRIFGRYDSCPLPDPKDRQRFLDRSSSTRAE